MYLLYFIGLLPVFVGAIVWYREGRVNWAEWGISSGMGLLTALIFQIIMIYGMEGDQQTFSGQIVSSKHYPAWLEHYEIAVYRSETIGSGKNAVTISVFDHWEDETRWHAEYWEDYSNIGTTYGIDAASYAWTVSRFGGQHSVAGQRETFEHDSYMISGDPNDYEATNLTGFNIPVTDVRHWSNKVQCCPSVFSYTQVPADIHVYPYPLPTDPFHSNRLIGQAAKDIDLLTFDQMNARLGPTKKVNVIIVGAGDKDSSFGHWQEAAWIGGKKNDIVLCYGGPANHPTWTYCFGWTEQAVVKRDLETIALQGVSTAMLPAVEQEIARNYTIKDWKKFDYLTIDPPDWSYWILIAVVVATQGTFWAVAKKMEEES